MYASVEVKINKRSMSVVQEMSTRVSQYFIMKASLASKGRGCYQMPQVATQLAITL